MHASPGPIHGRLRHKSSLQGDNARLQDETDRLQDNSNTSPQEEIAQPRTKITYLESDEKRKREDTRLPMQSAVRRCKELKTNITAAPSIEGGNSAVSDADTTSRVAHHRPAPLTRFSPHEKRSSDGRTNAADDNEVLGSSSDSSWSPDSDAYDSWSAPGATNESITDEIVLQPSPSPGTGSLIPHFPYKVFLVTFLDDNDTSTAQTIEFDDISVEYRQAVVEHTEGLVERGLEKWKSWDRVVNPHNKCVYQKASGK